MFTANKPLRRSAASRQQAFNIATALCCTLCGGSQSPTTASHDFLTLPMRAAVDALWAAPADAVSTLRTGAILQAKHVQGRHCDNAHGWSSSQGSGR